MRKILMLIMMWIINLSVMGQATSLIVDNQTPGWLSSKINYGDQKTVVNLRVTGYINQADINFINQLISGHSLHGRLDLSDVEIVNNDDHSYDNIMVGEPASIARCDIRGSLKHLLLPYKLRRATYACSQAYCDTVTIGGVINHPVFNDFFVGANASFTTSCGSIKCLIFREGVDSIGEINTTSVAGGDRFAMPDLNCIKFPTTLK